MFTCLTQLKTQLNIQGKRDRSLPHPLSMCAVPPPTHTHFQTRQFGMRLQYVDNHTSDRRGFTLTSISSDSPDLISDLMYQTCSGAFISQLKRFPGRPTWYLVSLGLCPWFHCAACSQTTRDWQDITHMPKIWFISPLSMFNRLYKLFKDFGLFNVKCFVEDSSEFRAFSLSFGWRGREEVNHYKNGLLNQHLRYHVNRWCEW